MKTKEILCKIFALIYGALLQDSNLSTEVLLHCDNYSDTNNTNDQSITGEILENRAELDV